MQSDPIDLAREPDFWIGGLHVRPAHRETRRAEDAPESLEPRVMQVLVALARARGEVVTRDDLVATCWGGRIIGDDAVHRCIARVRKLGEVSGAFALETIAKVGYRLTETQQPARAQPALPAEPASRDPILAVLPFDNLSGDPDLLYFSDGVSEEILHALARIANLKVIGRASSFQFRAPNKVVRTIAGELKTSHLLDGSVRRSGGLVRVSAHLMEAESQTVIWSDRFDRDLSDILALQDEIASAVAAALNVRFAARDTSGNVSADAYDLFLRGSVWSRDVTSDSQHRAIALLEKAVETAPTLARAWSELALARAQARYLEGTPTPVGPIETAAKQALELDPKSQGAWAALFIATPPFAFQDAEALLERSARSGAQLPLLRAIHLFDVGRCREAEVELSRARGIDPFLQMQIFYAAIGELCRGELDDALTLVSEASDRWPHVPLLATYTALWAAHSRKWDAVERATTGGRALGAWRSVLPLKIDVLQNGPREGAFDRVLQADAAGGFSGAETLAFIAEAGGADWVYAAANRLRPQTVRRPELGVGSWFMPVHRALREDQRFPGLCVEAGLAHYWIATGRWPDCATDDSLPYDLKARCEALAD